MNKTTNQQKLCGTRLYNKSNCNNKIRKIGYNKFETIYLLGKHAFDYSVIVKSNYNETLKETIFPSRKEALCFFTLSVNKYKNYEPRRVY